MHILPGLLALLLASAAWAADERLIPYFGYWSGIVTTSANSCEWKVKLRFRPDGESLRGSFTYSGPCSKKTGTGIFNALPDESDCMKGSFSLSGLPGMNGEACFGREGNITFKSGFGEGSLELSGDGKEAELQARSLLGTAEGNFTKLVRKKSRKAASKGKKDAKKAKTAAPAPEVFIGGY